MGYKHNKVPGMVASDMLGYSNSYVLSDDFRESFRMLRVKVYDPLSSFIKEVEEKFGISIGAKDI